MNFTLLTKNLSRMNILKNTLKILVVLMLTASIFSCSKSSSKLNLIPKTSSMVMVLDAKSLAEKSGIENFTETKSFKKLLESLSTDEAASLKKFETILKNPKESGIDFKQEMILFMDGDKKEGRSIYFTLSLADKSKFEKLLTTVATEAKNPIKIEKQGDLNYTKSPGEATSLLVWNDKVVIMMVNEDLLKETPAKLKKIESLLKQSTDASLASNKDFTAFYKAKKDISFWISYGAFMEDVNPMYATLVSSQMPINLDGATMEFHLSFENGKVVGTFTSKQNKEMKALMEKYHFIKKDFDPNVLACLPQKSYATMAAGINWLDYLNFMKAMYANNSTINLDQVDAMLKQSIGLSLEEAVKTFAGEIVLNVQDYSVTEIENPATAWDPEAPKTIKTIMPKATMIMKMTSPALYDKIVELYVASMATKIGNYYSIPLSKTSSMFLGYINNLVIITNDESILKNASEGIIGAKSMKDSEIAARLGKSPFYFSVDLNKDNYSADFNNYLNENKEEDFASFLIPFMSTFTSFDVKMVDLNNSLFELKLKDQSQNSLKVILNSLDNQVEVLSEK